MTNEEKARKLASVLVADDQNNQPLVDLLLQMAKWKDKEFEKQLKIQKFKANLMESVIGTQGTMIEELLNEKND